ncbi:hypothetical protein M0804_004681 [Polistes exclamans]|nr:hypothetical protein M0804_004681 [Polistes exclamans]
MSRRIFHENNMLVEVVLCHREGKVLHDSRINQRCFSYERETNMARTKYSSYAQARLASTTITTTITITITTTTTKAITNTSTRIHPSLPQAQ